MSSRQKRQLIIFAEDIVSVGIERDFKNGKISNEDLVQFGIYQVALRHEDDLFQVLKTGEMCLAAKYVAASVRRYFGKTVRHQSIGYYKGQYDWEYRNGFYYGDPMAFEQAGLLRLKRIRAYGVDKRYLTAYVDYFDERYLGSDELVVVKTKMILKKVSSKGRSRYILTSFKYLTPRP